MTTDNATKAELWDIYDAQRNIIGTTTRYAALHEDSLRGGYHLVVHIWVLRSDGRLLLTRRAPEKEAWAGYWENPGGAALRGEDSLTAAVRELEEETGIRARPEELRLLEAHVEKTGIYDGYALFRRAPVEAIRLQPGETSAARWVTLGELDRLAEEKKLAGPIARRYRKLRGAIAGCLRERTAEI